MDQSPYDLHTSLDLYEAQPFNECSASIKRLLVARWINQGKQPTDLPRLTTQGKAQYSKILNEYGFELLQEILSTAEEAEAQIEYLQRQLSIAKATMRKYGIK